MAIQRDRPTRSNSVVFTADGEDFSVVVWMSGGQLETSPLAAPPGG